MKGICAASGEIDLATVPAFAEAMRDTIDDADAFAVFVECAGIALAARHRKQTRTEARRREASDARDLAKVSNLEADRQTAEAEEHAARSKRDGLAAEQQQLAAMAQRSSARDLQSHADEIDPDI